MKIGIYIEPGGDTVGGSEFCAAALAEAFASVHDVEIVHHKPRLQAEMLRAAFGTNLGDTRLRYAAPSSLPQLYGIHNPLKRFAAAKAWQADLSAPYDLFIAFTHNVPPFCHAKKGLLVVLFPFFEREEDVVFRESAATVGRYVKHAYYRYEWHARMRGYQARASISEFTRQWTRRRWRIDSAILNPPGADVADVAERKQPTILSVGRFTTHAHTKKQEEMISTFGQLTEARASGWTYQCAGGLSDLPEDLAFFQRVSAHAASHGARVRENVPRPELNAMFAAASIFWHATGYGVDETARPELMEHYGISTVEGMSAGCVPVVINRGGQREIVTHGVDGFLWDTLDELREFTRLLVADDELRQRMSLAAMARARELSRTAFVARARELIRPLIGSSETRVSEDRRGIHAADHGH